MSHVFISYKREDIERVEPLVHAMRAAGLEVWWDKDIPPGGSWRETIVEKLDGCTLCVAIWSDQSVGTSGRFVREEAERSARREAYLGVLIDPVPPPFGFSEFQAIDLAGWDGEGDDPRLHYLIETIRARLDGRPAPIAEAVPVARRPRRGKSRLPLMLGAGAALAIIAAVVAVLLVWRPWVVPPSPTDFVNAELARIPCTWAEISRAPPPGPDGVAVKIAGISAAPGSIPINLLRDAEAQGVALASVDVADVAAAPQAACAQLQQLAAYRDIGRQRLTLSRSSEPPVEMGGEPHYKLPFNVETEGLPAHVAILGLDTKEGLHVAVPNLREQIAQHPPPRRNGSSVGYDLFFPVPTEQNRSLGLILMTSDQPIDLELVESIGQTTDRGRMRAIEDAARAGHWRFELGITRCGFEQGADAQC